MQQQFSRELTQATKPPNSTTNDSFEFTEEYFYSKLTLAALLELLL